MRWLCGLGMVVFVTSALWAVGPVRVSVDAEEPLPAGALARFGSERFRLGKQDWLCGLSPDGSLIAVGRWPDRLEFLDALSGVVWSVVVFRKQDVQWDFPTSGAFSPSGKRFALGSGPSTWVVYNTASGQELTRFRSPTNGTRISHLTAEFDREEKLLLIKPRRVRSQQPGEGKWGHAWATLHALDTGKVIWSCQSDETAIRGAALAPDGKQVALWTFSSDGDSSRLKFVEPWSRKTLRELRLPDAKQVGPFRHDWKEFVTVGANSSVCELESGKRVRSFTANGLASGWRYSPDGRVLIAATQIPLLDPLANYKIRRLDLTTGKETVKRTPPWVQNISFAFLKEGGIRACGRIGNSLVVWDVDSEAILSPRIVPKAGMSNILFRSRDRILTASEMGEFCEWEGGGKLVRRDFLGPKVGEVFRYGELRDIELSPKGSFFLANTLGPVGLFDLHTGELQQFLSVPVLFQGWPLVRFTADESVLFLGRAGMDVKTGLTFPHLPDAKAWYTPTMPEQPFVVAWKSPAVTPTLWDSEFQVYDLRTGKRAPGFAVHRSQAWNVPAIEFLPGERYWLLNEHRMCITLIESATGRQLLRLPLAGQTVWKLGACRRGMAFVVLSESKAAHRITLYEGWTCKPRRNFHSPNVAATLAFAPDGRQLATGHETGTAYLWDLFGAETPLPANIEEVWNRLQSDNAEVAWGGMVSLIRNPEKAIPLLRRHVQPVVGKARSATAPQPFVAKESLAAFRAIEVLEWIGTPAAQVELERLGSGAAGWRLTLEAEAALVRLRRLRQR